MNTTVAPPPPYTSGVDAQLGQMASEYEAQANQAGQQAEVLKNQYSNMDKPGGIHQPALTVGGSVVAGVGTKTLMENAGRSLSSEARAEDAIKTAEGALKKGLFGRAGDANKAAEAMTKQFGKNSEVAKAFSDTVKNAKENIDVLQDTTALQETVKDVKDKGAKKLVEQFVNKVQEDSGKVFDYDKTGKLAEKLQQDLGDKLGSESKAGDLVKDIIKTAKENTGEKVNVLEKVNYAVESAGKENLAELAQKDIDSSFISRNLAKIPDGAKKGIAGTVIAGATIGTGILMANHYAKENAKAQQNLNTIENQITNLTAERGELQANAQQVYDTQAIGRQTLATVPPEIAQANQAQESGKWASQFQKSSPQASWGEQVRAEQAQQPGMSLGGA